MEQLEHRLLLAGDTYLVNFQLAGALVPTRYLADTGQVFGDRGNGFSYGWSSDHTDVSRDRNSVADQRLDTLIHFHAGQKWEFALENGIYAVTIAVGDPANNDGIHTINAEGVNFFNAVPDTNAAQVATRTVVVSDGRLTLDQGAAAEMVTRIDYIQIVGLPSAPNAAPATPTITEPATDGQVINPSDVHMEAVGFSDPDGNAHKSTDWEIWTVGSAPERVWQTLGITGVEKLHTHLGDGIFENSHAGRTDLISETIPNFDFNSYSLIIPGVSAGNHLTVVAEMIDATGGSGPDLSAMVDAFTLMSPASQNLMSDGSFELATSGTQTSNSSWVMTAQSDGVEPAAQFQTATWAASSGNKGVWFKGFRGSAANPVDARVSQVVTATTAGDYTLHFDAKVEANFASVAAGFRVTITSDGTGGSQTIELLQPPEYELRVRYRDDAGAVSNYATRRFNVAPATTVFPPELEDIASSPAPLWIDSSSHSVVLPGASPVPPQLRLEGNAGQLLLSITGVDGISNNVSNPPALGNHVNLRVVITGGSNGLHLGKTDLVFFDDHGQQWKAFLPAIDLVANQRLDLWVATSGSTYFGTAAQTEPVFTNLAREADLPIPFIVTEPGYVIEEVAGGLQLPVNVAFVPNPGPNPNDPLFYVTELYGTVKLVTRNFNVSVYATNLLNFNPTGNFPGSGEQGLAGIVVDPASGDLFVTRVTSTTPGIESRAALSTGRAVVERRRWAHGLDNHRYSRHGRRNHGSVAPDLERHDRPRRQAVRPSGRRLRLHHGSKPRFVPRQGFEDEFGRLGAVRQPVLQRRQRHQCPRLYLRIRLSQPIWRSVAGERRQAIRGGERAERRSDGSNQSGRRLRLEQHRRFDVDQRDLQLEPCACAGEHRVRAVRHFWRQPVPRIEARSCIRQ